MKHILPIIAVFVALTMLASCTDKEAMCQRLDYVSQCNRADTVFTEAWLPTVDSLVSYFDHHGNANEKMMVHYLKGRVHHDMRESPIALECYQKAVEMADTTQKNCDFHTLAAIYGQMADLFDMHYLPEDEMKAQLMAEHFFRKDGDTLATIKAYELRVKPYFLMNKKDSMEHTMLEARKRFIEIGNSKMAAQAIYSMISICLDRGDINEAKHWMDIYERESGNFDEKGDLIEGGYYYYDKGKYFLAIGESDSARGCFEKALVRGIIESGYKGLFYVYKQKHISDSIAKYAELYATANDSSYLYVNQEKVHQISAMYNYTRNKEIASQKERETSELESFIIIMFFGGIAFLSFLGYLFHGYRAKQATRLNHLQVRMKSLEDIIEEKEREMRLADEHAKTNLDKEIKEKQSILDSANKELSSLKRQMTKLQEKTDRILHDRLEEEFYSIGFVEEFESKYREYHRGYVSPKTREWLRLEKVFSIHFPTFYQKITSKDGMTKEHVRICMLIRMGFKEKMMALALKTDGKRIDRAKRQANKILYGEDSASGLKNNLIPFF